MVLRVPRAIPRRHAAAGLFYPVDPAAITRVEDRSRPGYSETFKDFTIRLTGAVTSKHKLTAFMLYQNKCACFWQISQTTSPEATNVTTWPIHLGQASWTYTATNRLLVEAGVGIGDGSYTIWPRDGEQARYPIPIQEQRGALSLVIHRAPTNSSRDTLRMNNWRASMTYTTGSHVFKVGADSSTGWKIFRSLNHGVPAVSDADFIPNQVTICTAGGSRSRQDLGLGLWAQDRWTLNRLTLTAGIRLDLNNESVDQSRRSRRSGCRTATRCIRRWRTSGTGRTGTHGSAPPTTCSGTAGRR